MEKLENINAMFANCHRLKGNITISNPNLKECEYVFRNTCKDTGEFTINYAKGCEEVASKIYKTATNKEKIKLIK